MRASCWWVNSRAMKRICAGARSSGLRDGSWIKRWQRRVSSASEIYITNAVKHFKWEPRGKRRLHKRPDVREIDACNGWLQKEIEELKPAVIVALGATALRALIGSALTIEAARRQPSRHACGALIVATYHPSAILRAEGDHAVDLRSKLVADLKAAGNSAAATDQIHLQEA